jgi:hypothetical protein
MSCYDQYRDPRPLMARRSQSARAYSPTAGDRLAPPGSSPGPAEMIDPEMTTVVNRSGQPGGSNAPRTHYATAGHRPPPPHVQAAVRRQRVIDAESGQLMANCTEHELQRAARHLAHASAVNRAIMTSPSHSGSLGGGVALARPTVRLPWLFFGGG